MIKLDDNLLQELGLGALPPEEKKRMLAHIYETLEMRVGMELAKQMSDAQLNEFEEFINRNDEAGALRWLESNFPNYKDVVAAEFEKLKAEIKQVAPQILASSQQAAQAAAMPGSGQQQSMPPTAQQPYGPTPDPYQQGQPAAPQQYAAPQPAYQPQPQPYPSAPQQPAMHPQQQYANPQPTYPPQQPGQPVSWQDPQQQGQPLPQQGPMQQSPYQQPTQSSSQNDYDLAA
jgi:hypothetical protein